MIAYIWSNFQSGSELRNLSYSCVICQNSIIKERIQLLVKIQFKQTQMKIINSHYTDQSIVFTIILKCGSYYKLMISWLTKVSRFTPRTFSFLVRTQVFALHNPDGSRKVELYQKIKEKQMRGIKNNQLNQESISRYYKQHRCDGCNSVLQSTDKQKYGFIKQDVLKNSVKGNIKIIENTYGPKASSSDGKTLEVISEVEKELNVKIFNNQTKKLDNLDSVEVLLRLQERLDKFEEEEQTIKRIKKERNQLYCLRCYSLKYHNKLPSDYDVPDPAENNQQILMSKVLRKHQNTPTFFIYMIDVLDVAGSFKKYVFNSLLKANVDFCIVVNKLDIVNEKYLNRHMILEAVRQRMLDFVDKQNLQEHKDKIGKIKVILASSIDRSGIKSLEEYLDSKLIKRMQLVGFPNTGKTTLLNQLGRTNKPTSKYPGTTLYINQHFHKKYLIYDMPGMNSQTNLSNKISKPSLKALLTWNKFYSPPVLLHQAFFYGGKVQIRDVKIILFGMGGSCSSDNRWFLLNYQEFWKGLPPLNQLNIQKHTLDLEFVNGQSQDLQIAGWGFISFRLAGKNNRPRTKQLNLYLPLGVQFCLRDTILKDIDVLNYKSVVKKRHRLQRVHQEKHKKQSKIQQ